MTHTFLDDHPDLAWTSAQKQSSPEDPFIELEALDNARVDTWVNAQNARTTAAFGKTPQTDALTARLKTAYTSQERIVSCSRYNDWGYNTWQDETHPLGIVRRTPWSSWLAASPNGKPSWMSTRST
jgi:prolyl oligopeptidase